MINFQRPAFPDLNNFCNEHLYTKLLSQFRAVNSYGTRNTRAGKQNRGTHREYSSKPLKHSIVKRILVLKW